MKIPLCFKYGGVLWEDLVLLVVVHGIHEEHKSRGRDEHNVEDPEAILRDREGMVVANLLASWLQCVARKLLLFIIKHVAGHCTEDQHPEDQHEEQPETTQHG